MAKAKDKKKKADRQAHDGSNGTGGSDGVAAAVEAAGPMSRKEHDKQIDKLQTELVKLQEWVKANGVKICVLFEGRDAAGKGGIIKRMTERTSPRVFRVVALPSPTERE